MNYNAYSVMAFLSSVDHQLAVTVLSTEEGLPANIASPFLLMIAVAFKEPSVRTGVDI